MNPIAIRMALATLGVSSVAFAVVANQRFARTAVYHVQGGQYSSPAHDTDAEETAFMEAVVNKLPLPAGWTQIGDEGEVTGVLTGRVDALTLRVELVVTVRADPADLETAWLYSHDRLVCTATRAAGSIADDDGKSVATLSAFVSPLFPYALELRWRSTSGAIARQSVSSGS